MAKRRIPNWMLFLPGPVGRLLKASKYGVIHAMWWRPYLAEI
jgi:hypothetical protein